MNSRHKRIITNRLIQLFFWACPICFILLGISYIIALRIPLNEPSLFDKVIITKLTFASLGILFGIFQVFLGILLALIGVTIEYDVDASIGPGKLKLASASPGILLMIIGNILFGFSLMREFEVSESKTTKSPTNNSEPKFTQQNKTPGNKQTEPDPLLGTKGP